MRKLRLREVTITKLVGGSSEVEPRSAFFQDLSRALSLNNICQEVGSSLNTTWSSKKAEQFLKDRLQRKPRRTGERVSHLCRFYWGVVTCQLLVPWRYIKLLFEIIIEKITCYSKECWPHKLKNVQKEKNQWQNSGQDQEGNSRWKDHYKQWHGGRDNRK